MIEALWRWTLYGLAMFGAASLVALVVFTTNLVLWPENARRLALPVVSPTAEELARHIAPELVELADAYEPQFIAHASNPIGRWAAGRAYPIVVDSIPTATEIGIQRLLTRFGGMKIEDVINLIVKHAEQAGEPIDDSLRRYHPSRNP